MDLLVTLTVLFDKYNYYIPNNTKGITKSQLLKFIASRESTKVYRLGYSIGGWQKFIKRVFPDKPNNTNYYDWLLLKDDLKYCTKCDKVLPCSHFWKNISKQDSLNTYCSACMKPLNRKAHVSIQAKYKANKLNATPSWASLEDITQFYKNCPELHHVDHIIPLQGKYVCGLHVLSNLQYLPAKDNINKSNYHESEEYWKK